VSRQTTKNWSTPTTDDLFKSFAATWRARGFATSTSKNYLSYVRQFAASIDRNLLDVERTDLEAFVTRVMDRLSVASAAYAARSVKAFYKWLHEEEAVAENPAARLRIPVVPVPSTKVADADEVQILLASCRDGKLFASFNDRRDAALIHVLRSAGLRIGEAAAMELRDIDQDAGSVLVPKTKTRKPRTVGLDAKAGNSLSWYFRLIDVTDQGLLWRTSNGRPLTQDGVKQAFRRRAKRADVKLTPHQLRRRFAVDWCRKGGSQASLQALAGWNSSSMPARYYAGEAGLLALEEQRRLFAS